MTNPIRNKTLLDSLWDNPKSKLGLLLVICYFVVAVLGRFVTGDPLDYVGVPLEPPRLNFWLGTTGQGQSVLKQYGALPTLLVGFSTGALVIALGSIIGGMAGYFGGWVDSLLCCSSTYFCCCRTAIDGDDHSLVATWSCDVGWFGPYWMGVECKSGSSTSCDDARARICIGIPTIGSFTRCHAVQILPTMSLLLSTFIGATVYAIGAQVGLGDLGLGDIGKVTWGTNLYWASNDAALLRDHGGHSYRLECIAMLGFALTLISFGMDESQSQIAVYTSVAKRVWVKNIGILHTSSISEPFTNLSSFSTTALLSIQNLQVAFVGEMEDVVAVKGPRLTY